MAEGMDGQSAAREYLNTHVQQLFEEAWPTAYRELGRMARARWHIAALGDRPRLKWRITTRPQLLVPPAPSEFERALGVASACIHADVQCGVRGAIEGWTITFRAYESRDELQVFGAHAHLSPLVTPSSVRHLLRMAAAEGPGYYPLTLSPYSPRSGRPPNGPAAAS